MTLVSEVKVQAVGHLLNSLGLKMRAMLQDQLFQVQEGSLVISLLPNLYYGDPGVICETRCAIFTLLVLYGKFDDEDLLKDGRGKDFLLHSQLYLDSPGVRLCPDEVRIDELHLRKAFEALQEVTQQLLRFILCEYPGVRRAQISSAMAAEEDGQLLRDSLCYVHLPSDTIYAHVRWIRLDRRTTEAAKNPCRGRGE